MAQLNRKNKIWSHHEKGQKPQINPREWDKGFSIEPGEEYGRVWGRGQKMG